MNAVQNKKWKRMLAEAAVIVVGILLAFSIDAWWDENRRSQDERALMRALVEDLQDKKAKVEEGRRFSEAIAVAATELIRIGIEQDSIVEEDKIDRLIADTWWYNSGGGWESAPMALLFSGGAASLSDPVLVQKLAKLRVEITRAQNFWKLDEDFHHNTYTPYLIANAYMPQLTNRTEHQPGVPEFPYVFPRFVLEHRKSHLALVRSEEFQNMMIAKLDRIQDILQNAVLSLDKDMDEAIELLNEDLADLN